METKVIILSLRFWWFYLVYKGIKTIEIRKTYPKNFRGIVFVYVSKTNWKKDLMKIPENEREFFKQFVGKVGLKFTLNTVGMNHNFINGWEETSLFNRHLTINDEEELLTKSCLTLNEFNNYSKEERCYAWHVDNLVIFDTPKEIGEFKPVKWDKCGVKDKNGLYQCVKCPYGRNWLEGCKYKPLTKAPQSWCYALPVCQE